MKYKQPASSRATSHYQDYFESAFAAADLAASWWQPFLKGMGRSHLELAGMQSRNALAMLLWGRSVAASRSPMELISANFELCRSLVANANEALPKVSGALSQATQPPPAFELLELPQKPQWRDTLHIPEESEVVDDYRRRRVA